MNNLSMKREQQEMDKKAQKSMAEEDKLSELQINCKRLKTNIAHLTENAKKMYDKSGLVIDSSSVSKQLRLLVFLPTRLMNCPITYETSVVTRCYVWNI